MEEQRAVAGWYPVSDDQLRYWDGQVWTEHFHDVRSPNGIALPDTPRRPGASRLRTAATTATASLRSDDQDLPEGTVWSAIGKNLGKVTTGRYRLDRAYLTYSKGALRTEWQQVHVAGIVDVDVRQSLAQKTRAVYTVVVRLQDRSMFTLDDIPDGPAAQRVITHTAVEARLALEQRTISIDAQRHDATNTVRQEIRVESVGGHTVQPQTVAGIVVPQHGGGSSDGPSGLDLERAPVATSDAGVSPQLAEGPNYISQLRELGDLRDAGILTDDEFTAKKTEILGRM